MKAELNTGVADGHTCGRTCARPYRIVLIAIALATNIFQQCLAASTSKTTSIDKITIDGNLPLTGPIAAFCGNYPKAFTMGIDDACKQLAVPRQNFNIDFQDNAGKPAQAVSVIRKQLLSSPPSLYISGTSPCSVAIVNDINQLKVPHMLVSFDAFLCHDGPNRMRILTSHKIEAPVYIERAKELKTKKVLIIALDIVSYNNEFSKIVEPAFAKAGIESSRETFTWDTKDFKTLALKAVDYKPDMIIVAGHSVQEYPLLSALRSYGLIKKDNIICSLDFIDLIHNKTPKSELIGIPFVAPPYELTSANAEKKKWVEHFQQVYSKDPSYVEAYAYDAGRIMVTAYKKCGQVDAQSIRKVLPFHGICGEINIDQDGDLNTKLQVAQVMPDGTVRSLK